MAAAQRYVIKHPTEEKWFRFEGWTQQPGDAVQFSNFDEGERFRLKDEGLAKATVVSFTPQPLTVDPRAQTDYDPFGYKRYPTKG